MKQEKNTVQFSEIRSKGCNDIEMLELTAFSFSPENAPEEVKKQAKHITPNCNQDAVAYALHYVTSKADTF